MTRRSVTIVNERGFHARAASRFVECASHYRSRITVGWRERSVDGKSILGLLTLAAPCGATLELTADGPDESDAVEGLAQLVVSRFGEER